MLCAHVQSNPDNGNALAAHNNEQYKGNTFFKQEAKCDYGNYE